MFYKLVLKKSNELKNINYRCLHHSIWKFCWTWLH